MWRPFVKQGASMSRTPYWPPESQNWLEQKASSATFEKIDGISMTGISGFFAKS
jgi:hypothetical protein